MRYRLTDDCLNDGRVPDTLADFYAYELARNTNTDPQMRDASKVRFLALLGAAAGAGFGVARLIGARRWVSALAVGVLTAPVTLTAGTAVGSALALVPGLRDRKRNNFYNAVPADEQEIEAIRILVDRRVTKDRRTRESTDAIITAIIPRLTRRWN